MRVGRLPIPTLAIADPGQSPEIPQPIPNIAAPIIVKGIGWEKERRLIFKNFTTDDYDTQNVVIDTDITAVGSLVIIDRE